MKNEKGIDPVTNRFQVKYYFSILYPFPWSERPKALPVEWHIPLWHHEGKFTNLGGITCTCTCVECSFILFLFI